MKNINIEKTASSPAIILDEKLGLIELRGKCYPENTFEFYKPIQSWVEGYIDHAGHNGTTINIGLTYFNSATSQCIFELLEVFSKATLTDVAVNWLYHEDNDHSYDNYEDYTEDFPNLNIQAIVIEH